MDDARVTGGIIKGPGDPTEAAGSRDADSSLENEKLTVFTLALLPALGNLAGGVLAGILQLSEKPSLHGG